MSPRRPPAGTAADSADSGDAPDSADSSDSGDAPDARSRGRGLGASLLSLPLFYKILVANAVIVLIFSIMATWVAVALSASDTPLLPFAMMAVAGAAVSVGVNAVIIQVALEPLRLLKQTADRVQQGQLEARVPLSSLADRDMQRLTDATNGMLDRLQEYRRRLREVAARALNAAEEERRRISLELHDDTSQRLAAILMRLRLARSATDSEAKDAVLEEVRRELVETADSLRRYAQGLRPPALDELGLGAAVESHVRHVSEASPIPVSVKVDEVGRLDAPEVELAVYRIVQEAITNAIRHSRALRVAVHVEQRDGAVVATVEDDGVGFDMDRQLASTERDHGLGLFGMRERAEYVGGRVEVSSQAGVGTVVRVVVPLAGPGAPLA